MAKITVRTNGQTLKVNASVSHWTSAALAVVASGDDDIPSTTTTTITSDYDMHFANTATTAVITVTQVDGTTLVSQTFEVGPGVGPRVLNPVPDPYQQASDNDLDRVPLAQSNLLVGQALFPRELPAVALSMTSGRGYLTYFNSAKSETVTRVYTETSSTPAGDDPTLVRVGLYTVDPSDDSLVALVASTPNDAPTTMWGTASTSYTTSLSAGYAVTAGTRYAVMTLCVTAQTAPTLVATAMGTVRQSVRLPRTAGYVGSLTDLPAGPVAIGSITATTSAPYVELLPAS